MNMDEAGFWAEQVEKLATSLDANTTMLQRESALDALAELIIEVREVKQELKKIAVTAELFVAYYTKRHQL